MEQINLNITNNGCPTAPHGLLEFYERHIHGYASLIICIMGAAGQSLNLYILTRKNMINSTNLLLAAIAAAYLLMMLTYMPIIWHMFFNFNYFLHRKELDANWSRILLVHADVFQMLHMYCALLSLIVGFLRYLAMAHPFSYKYWSKIVYVKRAVIACSILCILHRIPLVSLVFRLHLRSAVLKELTDSCFRNMPIASNIIVLLIRIDTAPVWLAYYLRISYFLFNVTPSILLAALNYRLILILKTRRKRPCTQITDNKEEKANRLTRMLVVVLFLFLLSEIPQGMLFIVGIILECRQKVNDAMNMENFIDLLIMATSSFNVIVYYYMYPRFRNSVNFLFRLSDKNPSLETSRESKL